VVPTVNMDIMNKNVTVDNRLFEDRGRAIPSNVTCMTMGTVSM